MPLGGALQKPPNPKRVTTATLASQLESLSSTLPTLVKTMEELSLRQAAMEKQMAAGPAAPLSQPLGLGIRPKPAGTPALGLLGPPPRTARASPQPQLPLMGLAGDAEAVAEEAKEELGLQVPPSTLSQAVLEQSRALTTLVAQLAGGSGDLLTDPAGPAAHLSARGASQRAKMQEELSSDKGVFYTAVLQNMAKRMAPASSLSADPAELLQQGICLSRYWERFGGFAGQRDLGAIAHTLAHAMDALQAGRINQASDHIALLAVCVEQMSMDSGRAELGYQLTWLEEPPASMFAARSAKSAMHTRAFAPLASQRWVAIVLSYVKELDVIAAKRADMRKGGAPSASGSGVRDEDQEDHSFAFAAKEAPTQKAGPVTSCGLPSGLRGYPSGMGGSSPDAFRPCLCETSGGGASVVGAPGLPSRAKAASQGSASFPRAGDHTTASATLPACRHPMDEHAEPQPPLKAANPLLCESPGASFERLTGPPRSLPKPPIDQFSATLSFREWAAALPRWILKSRSPPLLRGLALPFLLLPAGGVRPHLPRLSHCRFPSWDCLLPVAHGCRPLPGAACASGGSCTSSSLL